MFTRIFKIFLLFASVTYLSCDSSRLVRIKKGAGAGDCTATPDAENCLGSGSSLSVTPSSSVLGLDQVKKFKATVTYSDKTTKDVTSDATWSSSATSVMKSVQGSTGSFKADSAGSATITAKFQKLSDSASVTVRGAALVSLYIFPDMKPMYQGFVHRLKLFGKYADDSVEDLTDSADWSSSDTGVATVDDSSSKGAVTLLAAGTTTISATVDSITATRSMTVAAPTLVSIDVVPSSFSIPVGYTQKVSAVGVYSNGMSFDLSDSVVWSSSATSVASISNNSSTAGLTTALAGGLSTITATTIGISGTSSLSVTVTALASVTVEPSSLTFAESAKFNLISYGVFSDSSVLDITSLATWASDNAGVTVSNASGSQGQITANTASTSANVSATHSSLSGTSVVTVSAVTLTSIAIDPATVSIKPSGMLQLSVIGTFSDTSTLDLTQFATWSSSDIAVALVGDTSDSKGILAGVAAGTATITATYSNLSATKSITVDAAASAVLSEILVTPSSFSVDDGDTLQFESVAIYSDFSVTNVTNTAAWTSSATGVATVGAGTGLLTSVSPGGVAVTATSGGKSATAYGFVTTSIDNTNPTAGTFSASSNVGATGFTLNWSAASDNVTSAANLEYFLCSGANAAAIDTDAECLAETQEMNWTSATTSKVISGKAPTTTYYYNVVVRDAVGNQSIYNGKTQATTNDTTSPTAGTFSASTGVSETGFTLNWSAASDNVTSAASLEYFVCSGASAAAIDTYTECLAETQEMNWTTNTLTQAITGKTPGTTYYYNVIVRDAAANKTIYNGKTQATASDTTDPTPATFAGSTGVTETGFTLNWNAASDNVTAQASLEYFVCSGASAVAIDTVAECVAATQVMNWTANTLTVGVTGRTPGTTYYYNAVVRDGAGNRAIYNGKTQATIADTTDPTAGTFSASSSVSETAFTLNWSAASDNVTSAASLQYFVCSGANAAAIDTDTECLAATQEMNWTANTLTKSITGKTAGTTYYYNVVVRDAAGNDSIYDGKTQATANDVTSPTAGTFSASTSVTTTSFNLNWSAASDNITAASSLEYFVCSGANAAAIDTYTECLAETQEMNWTANTTTLAVSGKVPGTTYYYNVVVRDTAGNKAIYNGRTQTTTGTSCPSNYVYIPADTNLNATNFCVMKYEAKDVSGVATSDSAGTPWGGLSRGATSSTASSAWKACKDLGAGYDLISNTQWQAVARNIEGVSANWSNGSSSGSNAINRGHTDSSPAAVLAASTDNDPCSGTSNTSCATNSHSDFTQKRTHTLSTGQIIWDFSGNVFEWVRDNNTTTQGANSYVSQLTSPTYDLTKWGPAGSYAAKNSGEYGGLGYGNYNNSAGAIHRGSGWNSGGNGGIFGAGLDRNTSFTDAGVGFRCVYKDSPEVGSFTTSSGVYDTGFTLNWLAASDDVTAASSLEYYLCSGASSAAIDTVAECEAATQEMNWTANTLTKAITGKTVETTYYYNVIVKDAAGNKSLYEGKSQSTTSLLPTLTAHYRLNENSPSGVGSVLDVSGNDYHGDATGTITSHASGKDGYAYTVAGSGYVSVPSNSDLSFSTGTAGFTIAMWQKTSNSGVARTLIDKRETSGTYIGYHMIAETGLAFQLNDATSTHVFNNSGVGYGSGLNDNQWHHVVWTVQYGSNQSRLYVDGTKIATIDISALTGDITNTRPLLIGGHATNSAWNYVGSLDEVKFFDSYFDDTDAYTLYNQYTVNPVVGAFSTTSNDSATSFTLNWTASSDDITPTASLQYYVCSGASIAAIDTVAECESATQEMNWSTNTLTKTLTGKTAGNTYYYNVIARDGSSNKSLYEGLTHLAIDPTAPTSVTYTTSTVTITGDSPSGCPWDDSESTFEAADGVDNRTSICGSGEYTDTVLFKRFNSGSGLVPAGATINGIEVMCNWGDTGNTRWATNQIQLMKAGVAAGSNYGTAPYTEIPNSTPTTTTFGGSSDKWGTTWSAAEVNNANFGISMRLLGIGGSGTPDVFVDYCGVTIHYTP